VILNAFSYNRETPYTLCPKNAPGLTSCNLAKTCTPELNVSSKFCHC